MTINRRLPSGGGEAPDLGPIEDRLDGLDTTVAAMDTISDKSVLRLDGLDGISDIGEIGSSITVTPGGGNGGVKMVTLTAPNCDFGFNAGMPDTVDGLEIVVTQDATGGRTITWTDTVFWAGGVPPVLSTAPGATDRLVFTSYNGGATWFGDVIGKGYA